MGKKSQAKGRRAEIELAGLLRERGYDVRPGKPMSFGREPDLVGLAGIHCELKRRECVDLSAALLQAEQDAAFFGGGLPAVFHRGNRQRWRVTMELDNWLSLYDRQKTAKIGEEVNNDTETAKGACGASDIPQQGSSGKGGGYCPPHTSGLFGGPGVSTGVQTGL